MDAGDGATSTVGVVGIAGIAAGASMRTWAGFLSGAAFGSGIFFGGSIFSGILAGGAVTGGALPQVLQVLQVSQQPLRRKPSRSLSRNAWLPQPHELVQVSHVLGAHDVQAGSWQRFCQVHTFGQLSQVSQLLWKIGVWAGLQVSHLRANRPFSFSRSLWPKLSQPQASWQLPQLGPQPVETTGAGAGAGAAGAGFLSPPA